MLLEAYARWGADCLSRLSGMFAFALYDERRSHVFLARDRAGEKPLYYRSASGHFSFASELKALLADPSCPRRLDRGALSEYLAYGFVPGGHCILRGMRKLPPAHAALYDVARAELRVWRYWELPRFDREEGKAAPGELAAELERLLEDAVRRQLLADVPVGILLSGGLDSSLITAIAARVSSGRVRTFTISFPGAPSYDEAEHARRVANHFGTEHVELAAEAASLDLLPELARQYDEPIADSSMLPTHLVSRLIRQQATVALGGDGGDELFGGYRLYTRVLSQAGIRRWIPRPLRAAARAGAGRFLPAGLPGRNYLLELAADPVQRMTHAYLFDQWSRSRLLARDLRPEERGAPPAEAVKLALFDPSLTQLQQATTADFHSYLPEDILVKVDRASMLASLEVRAPWLDHRIVEFAFGRVPDRMKAVGKARKILPKALGRRLLPPSFDLDRKQGFGVPLERWFATGWGRLVEDVLADASQDIFDRTAIRRLIADQKRGYHNVQRLFALTLFELWRREYRVQI